MAISFYLETYGCSLNSADSDIMIGCLRGIDAQRVEDIKHSDVVILNTCGVKEPTEDRIIHRLEELGEGTRPVIVTGCLPGISLARIRGAIPNYAAILGPQATESVNEILLRVLSGERGILHLESTDVSKLRWLEAPAEGVICTVPICEGCLGNCSYCAVKFARGQVKSHSETEICLAIQKCTRAGYREIRLTSQDLGAYGTDIGSDLVTLMRRVDEIPGQHMFRLGMFNPNLVVDSISSLLRVMRSDHFFKFFHVPLQSGSDTILSAMGRLYALDDWARIIRTIREHFSDATVATDIIVGFPGESKEDFELTMEAIRRVQPSIVNISKYGDRPGTAASEFTNKVETSVKKQRSRQLTTLVHKIQLQDNESWAGWSGPVIVSERGSRGGLLCRNSSYRPIIVHDVFQLGSIIDVRVTRVERTHLIGETISCA